MQHNEFCEHFCTVSAPCPDAYVLAVFEMPKLYVSLPSLIRVTHRFVSMCVKLSPVCNSATLQLRKYIGFFHLVEYVANTGPFSA